MAEVPRELKEPELLTKAREIFGFEPPALKPPGVKGGKSTWTGRTVVLTGGLAAGEAVNKYVFKYGIGEALKRVGGAVGGGAKEFLEKHGKKIGGIIGALVGILTVQVTPTIEVAGNVQLAARGTGLGLILEAIRELRDGAEALIKK